jgi:hypothetical protein
VTIKPAARMVASMALTTNELGKYRDYVGRLVERFTVIRAQLRERGQDREIARLTDQTNRALYVLWFEVDEKATPEGQVPPFISMVPLMSHSWRPLTFGPPAPLLGHFALPLSVSAGALPSPALLANKGRRVP